MERGVVPMGNLGVSPGTATTWLGLNVEPDLMAGPALPCPKMSGAGENRCPKVAPLDTRVTSFCPFGLSDKTIFFSCLHNGATPDVPSWHTWWLLAGSGGPEARTAMNAQAPFHKLMMICSGQKVC